MHHVLYTRHRRCKDKYHIVSISEFIISCNEGVRPCDRVYQSFTQGSFFPTGPTVHYTNLASSGALQSTGHACVVCMPGVDPVWTTSQSRLLSSKANQSVSKNSDQQWELVPPSQVSSTAHLTSTSVHLDLTRVHYYLWRELPCKHKGCSFILSLRLGGRVIA